MSKINYWKIMTRKKPMPPQDSEDTKLNRVFGTFDLTALGVSATLGIGVYVLAGHVAKLEAGPSVILSFFIAAAASFLAGLCYAEFSSRVPKSGSAYIFTYVAIGEFAAFIIGWNLLLEYIIGSASIAKGLSLYIDSLIDNSMKNFFKDIAPITATGNFLSSYFDFFAFVCPLLLGFALAFGLRKSAGMNNILCILNLCIVFFVVVVVLIYANIDYWKIDPLSVPPEYKEAVGNGGFFPFGFSGTVKGAATCFFGFVGFDCIATTGEEVHNPRKSVPRAILYSLIIIFLAYFGISLLTLMWPYYLLDSDAPIPHAFSEKDLTVSKWIITIGGIIGLITSLFGAMFPLPRILYAMSVDGLIFKEFSVISNRFRTPVTGTLCAALLTSCFAGLFDLAALVNMLSIGVLLAYTVVAISIIILRFSQSDQIATHNTDGYVETSNLLRPGQNITMKGFFMQLVRLNSSRIPNTVSTTVVGMMVLCYSIVSLTIALIITYGWDAIANGEMGVLIPLIILSALLVLFCTLISIQPRQNFISMHKPFLVPLVPFLPAVSVFINIYLMLMLDYYTWIRFGIWMIIGFILYFPYAWYHNSMNTNKITSLNEPQKSQEAQNKASAINNTCDEMKITQENLPIATSSRINDTINNNVNDSNDIHLAIATLDVVLEDEEQEHNDKKLSQSINEINVTAKAVRLEEKLSSNAIDKDEVVYQIDEILQRAIDIANFKEKRVSVHDENIFQNEKFLTHLSDVILQNRGTKLPRVLLRKSENFGGFKRSGSAPDLQDPSIIDNTSSSMTLNQDPNTQNFLNEPPNPLILRTPAPSVFNKELLEKFEEMKKKRMDVDDYVESSKENSDSSDDESIDKSVFREKLEKLLSMPPSRLSSLRPTPLPRVSLRRDEDDKSAIENRMSLPNRREIQAMTITLSNAMIQQQKVIFDEVLKNIKKDEER